jgi:tRNA threonylcarbamoyladenosine modification (KEOPS) complex  Pcc1 subunit
VVDEELHPDKVTKLLSTRGKHLCVEFAACDARMLRVSVNSFFDMTALATQTLDAF